MRAQSVAAHLIVTAYIVVAAGANFGAAAQLRVSPEEMAQRLIFDVTPRYPAEARDAGIQGTVQLDIVIDDEGGVSQLKVVAGHPLLAMAAVRTVEQWLYLPYTVDGEAVAVATTVIVTFTMV